MELWTGQSKSSVSFVLMFPGPVSLILLQLLCSLMSAQRSLIAEDVWPKPHGHSSHPSWLDAACGQ
jgi:hypothetical protein